MLSKEQKQDALDTVRKWLETFIIGLNLCPFAKGPFQRGEVRLVVADAENTQRFMQFFAKEIDFLEKSLKTETTLMIIPAFGRIEHLQSFLQYCEETIAFNHLQKKYQLVTFHPAMRFIGMAPDSPENLIGIAPYPILHILRAPSVEALGATVKKDVQEVNAARLKKMTKEEVKELWKKVI